MNRVFKRVLACLTLILMLTVFQSCTDDNSSEIFDKMGETQTDTGGGADGDDDTEVVPPPTTSN